MRNYLAASAIFCFLVDFATFNYAFRITHSELNIKSLVVVTTKPLFALVEMRRVELLSESIVTKTSPSAVKWSDLSSNESTDKLIFAECLRKIPESLRHNHHSVSHIDP